VPVNKVIGKRKNYRHNNLVEEEIVFKTETLCIYSSAIGSVGEKCTECCVGLILLPCGVIVWQWEEAND